MSEGALAAELGSLIHSHLPDKLNLRFEQGYKKLLPTGTKNKDITDLARADVTIWESFFPESSAKARQSVRYVIELKRASASNSRIDQDLRRLAAIVENSDGVRAFLCVVSEERRPALFTNKNGFALKDDVNIDRTGSLYVVTNVQKATFLFKNRDRAHYVCLIEVLARGEG